MSACPGSRLPGGRDGALGRERSLTRLCQQLKLSRPPTSHQPAPSERRPRPGPTSRGRFGAREAPGRSDSKQAGTRGRLRGRGKEAFPGRTRTRESGGAFLSKGVRRNGKRVALRHLRTHRGLAPPMRARGRHYLFSSVQPPLFDFREPGSVGRGGWGVARERGQQKRGGEEDPRQRYPVNTQSGAGTTPPPIPRYWLGGQMGGAGRGWGRAGGGDEEAGAGGQ